MVSLALLLVLAVSPAPDAARAQALDAQANALQQKGSYLEAQPPLREAIAIWTELEGADGIDTLGAQVDLAYSLRHAGDANAAIALLEHVVERLKRSTSPEAASLRLGALNNLASSYHSAGRLEEAKATFEQCLAALGEGAPSEDRARVLDNLAQVFIDQQPPDLASAEAYARRGLKEWQSLRRGDDVDLAVSMVTTGTLLMRKGDLTSARPLLEQALGMIQRVEGPTHPDVRAVEELLEELHQREASAAAAVRAAREKNLREGFLALVVVISLLLFMRQMAGRLAARAAVKPIAFLITRKPVLVGWAVGAIGSFVTLGQGMVAHGHPAVAAGLSLTCGGGLVVMVMGPLWMIWRLRTPRPVFPLEPGEELLDEWLANHFLGWESRGGKLLLTNHRLGFRPHRFNVQLATWSVPREEVLGLEVEGDRFLLVRCRGAQEPEWIVIQHAAQRAEQLRVLLGLSSADPISTRAGSALG